MPRGAICASLRSVMQSIDVEPDLDGLLQAYRRRLEQRFGERLLSFRLFGSRARGDSEEDSDADVAVVVRDLSEAERDWVIAQSFEAYREFSSGPLLAPLVWSEQQYLDRLGAERRIALDIGREGISR
jgi:predicted nucleotidyltransferase